MYIKIIASLFLMLAVFFRIYQLDQVPLSPYWEEVALGYDAYSISQTGADHHGNAWPIVAFESFGDWKPSLYFYAIVPFLWLFDVSVLAVRLPAALAGIGIVIAIGYLTRFLSKEIWPGKAYLHAWAFVAGLAVASVSPWLLLFSRGGWEVTLATSMLFGGVVSGLHAVKSNKTSFTIYPLYLYATIIFFGLALYAYHGTRFIAPLYGFILLGWWIYQLKTFWISRKTLFAKEFVTRYFPLLGVLFILTSILILPLAASLGSSQVSQRFSETTLFSDPAPVLVSNELRSYFNDALFARILFHRYIFYSFSVLDNMFSHVSFDFLFVSGDENPRHSMQFVGQLYLFESVALLAGIYTLVRRTTSKKYLWFACMVIAVIPASISQAAPHALRTLPLAPFLISLIAIGWLVLLEHSRHVLFSFLKVHTQIWKQAGTSFLLFIILSVYGFFVSQAFHYYFTIYPIVQAHEWQYGYQPLVSALQKHMREYSDAQVLVSRKYGRPAMYYWFYTKTDPREVQAASLAAKKNASIPLKDQSELLSFENILFVRDAIELNEYLSQEKIHPFQKKDLQDSNTKAYKMKNQNDHVIIAGEPDFVEQAQAQLESYVNAVTVQKTTDIKDMNNTVVWQILVIKKL